MVNGVFSELLYKISWSILCKALFKSMRITPLRVPLLFVSNKAVRVLCREQKQIDSWLINHFHSGSGKVGQKPFFLNFDYDRDNRYCPVHVVIVHCCKKSK